MSKEAVKITFLGAAETVTGSRYLVESSRGRLLVDCGLFQGLKKLRERNWAPPPFDPKSLDAVVLTHAHIDHSGYLPKLCSLGFAGPVYCTKGTRDLLKILLPDAAFLQEEEARHANRLGYSRHNPAVPLYTRDDAERCLDQLVEVPLYEEQRLFEGALVRFSRAGHIIGSASLQLTVDEKILVFTGDVGRPHDPVMKAPDPLPRCDYLVVESTYGDRRHPENDPEALLADLVNATVERGGVVVIPAFAVGRAQHILHLLSRLRKARRISELPIFLDSPMSIHATRIFMDHPEDHRLSTAECSELARIAKHAPTPEDSKAIDRHTGSMIVISASGMATGGRVLHHLKQFLPDPRNLVLFVGYQTAGTRGRSLLDGAEELKIQGKYVTVRARIAQIHGLSAHADAVEMTEWLRVSAIAPKRAFVTHGEPSAADAFRRRLRDSFGWDAVVPEDQSQYELS